MIGVQRRVERILAQLADDDSLVIEPTADLFESGVLDSFGMLEYIAELEKTFAVTISNEDLIPQNLWSVEAAVALIKRYLRNSNP